LSRILESRNLYKNPLIAATSLIIVGNSMRKRALLALLLLLSAVLFSTGLSATIVPAKAAIKNWTVDDDGPADFHTIQEAITASTARDIIVVNSGTYPENVVINKPISLKGMVSGQRPVIVGNQTVAVVKITANGVEFSGFNVTNGGYGDSYGDGMLGGGIELFGVSDCDVTNNLVYDNLACGISLVNANYNMIANNTCISNWIGIRLWSWNPQTTNYNVIRNNTCSFNLRNGIHLWSYVYKTATVNYNNITDNLVNANSILADYGGIDIGKSRGDYISGNIVLSNAVAIYLNSVFDSKFFHNTFLNNSVQVQICDDQELGSSTNIWDDGYPSGGNYWSSYNGTDADHDGIGDSPYVIDANNVDRYPLMVTSTPIPTPTPKQTPSPTDSPTPTPKATSTPSPSPIPVPSQSAFSVESNSTITELFFNSTSSELSFSVSGEPDTAGYVKVTIAKSLVSSVQNVKVYLDGNQLDVAITSDEDSWLLSFTYMHSTHHVRISLATNAATTLLSIEYWIWIGVVIIIVVIGVGLLLYLKKRKH